jgi:hypothetical protein
MLNLLRSDFATDDSTEAIARSCSADAIRPGAIETFGAAAGPAIAGPRMGRVVERGFGARPRRLAPLAWPEGLPLLAFLAGIVRSLVDNRAAARRRLAERTLAGVEARVTASPEPQLLARQCLAAINHFFAGDPDVLVLIAGLARQYLGGAEGFAARLSQKRRDAARKRLARAILLGRLDGFLP